MTDQRREGITASNMGPAKREPASERGGLSEEIRAQRENTRQRTYRLSVSELIAAKIFCASERINASEEKR